MVSRLTEGTKPEMDETIKTEEATDTSESIEEEITAQEEQTDNECLENEEDVSKEKEVKEKEVKEKKGPFKKKKNKQEELIAELNDRIKRQMAEFDNFRKRTEKEKSQMYEIGAKSIIEAILPVVDNFERALVAPSMESEQEKAYVEGIQMIYKQLMTELEGIGVKPIEALGQEFNPDFHNAVMQVESDEYESGFISQELQKGYMYRESVVRHSMVAVVQ